MEDKSKELKTHARPNFWNKATCRPPKVLTYRALGRVVTVCPDALALDVLAVAAHPDDVELSIGGTLIKLVDMGYRTGRH